MSANPNDRRWTIYKGIRSRGVHSTSSASDWIEGPVTNGPVEVMPVPAGGEIPDAAIEAAMRAAYDDQPQWTGRRGTSEYRPKTYEECYGQAPLEHADDVAEMRVALKAALPFLLAAGGSVEPPPPLTDAMRRVGGPDIADALEELGYQKAAAAVWDAIGA